MKGPVTQRVPERAVAGRVQVRPDTFVTQDTVGYSAYTHGYRQVLRDAGAGTKKASICGRDLSFAAGVCRKSGAIRSLPRASPTRRENACATGRG